MKKRDKKKQHASASASASSEPTATSHAKQEVPTSNGIRWHLRVGWWSLLLFLTLGITLEAMHGFKVQWYIGEQNATRRLMWTLAHAHGTLMALIHIGYAATLHSLGSSLASGHRLRSRCLSLATILMPLGFFAGGIGIYDGDPGLGILIVPVAATFLFVAVLLTAKCL